MTKVLPRGLLSAALLLPIYVGHAQATDPLPPETVLVGLTGTPASTEESFTIATKENLVVTLTDLQVPAALSSATVVVTQGGAIIGEAIIAPPASTANFAITAAQGQYTLYVFGAPNTSFSVGTFTVCVAPSANPSGCIQNASLAGNITAPAAAADPTISTVSVPLTVTTGGTFTVTFADDQFPAALNSAPNLALFQGSQTIALGIQSGATLNLNPGTYTLLGIAQASQTLKAGLWGITIAGPAGSTPILNATYAVGSLTPGLQANNTAAQTLTLQITDFGFPTPLGTAATLATTGGTVLGTTSIAAAAGPATFAAPVGVVELWSFATAGTGAGTYEVDLTSASGNLLQTAAAVSNASSQAFAYITQPLVAGNYEATATDFEFPQALTTLQFAVAQNGVILQKTVMASTVKFDVPAGPVVVLVDASAPTSGNGLFDVNIQTAAVSPQLEFDQTQAVGASNLFSTQTLNLGTTGTYDVTLTDLKFPAQFQDLDLVVSSGGKVLGKIIGGGTFPITASPGAYQLSFIATPATAQLWGMYGLQIVNAVPTVTLKASPTSVTSGAASTLSWTSTNATACTGSGTGFTGSQSTGSGSLSVSVTATTTFMLTCTGAGGSANQSVTVTVTAAAPSGGGGGGGALDGAALGLLGSLLLLRAARGPPRARRRR